MSLVTRTEPAAVLRMLEPVVAADPVEHNVLGTILARIRDDPECSPWCAYDDGAVAARNEPAHPVAVTSWPDVSGLAAELDRLPELTGLRGPDATVTALVDRLGRPVAERMAERLFRLDDLVEPAGVPGRARLAMAADVDLLADWIAAFNAEAFAVTPPDFDPRRIATVAIERGPLWLWTDPVGRPVSFANSRLPTAGVARIGPVYTPPALRGHGYASAVTARAAGDVLDRGGVPVLYTDLANPTSNRIYQAVGFRAVGAELSITF